MSVWLVTSQQVVLKMLPFDNKSEFQVVVDIAEGSTLEQTQAVLNQVSQALLQLPENFSLKQLKRAYRSKALRLHPDRGGEQQQFIT